MLVYLGRPVCPEEAALVRMLAVNRECVIVDQVTIDMMADAVSYSAKLLFLALELTDIES